MLTLYLINENSNMSIFNGYGMEWYRILMDLIVDGLFNLWLTPEPSDSILHQYLEEVNFSKAQLMYKQSCC